MFDAAIVRRWAQRGVELLAKHRNELNALNVFPIPDGDTGTNLYLTFKAAYEAEANRDGSIDDAKDALAAMARGSLLGARGNSGVILAQTLRAFSQKANESENLSLAELLKAGAAAARNAVANPQEGTALSVLDAVANSSVKNPSVASDVARDALLKTTDMLPALKNAGVVDAGGRGVVLLLDALAAAWNQKPNESPAVGFVPKQVPHMAACDADGKFELMFLAPTLASEELRNLLKHQGSSLVVTEGEEVSQFHIHLDDPKSVLEKISAHTSVKNVRIELLTSERKKRSVIAQAFGSGTVQLLAEQGVLVAASEPNERSSVGDFVDLALKSESEEIILIPADPDTVQVVEIAATLLKEMGISTSVVNATSLPALIAAISVFDESATLKLCTDKMYEAANAVKSFGISQADRNSTSDSGIVKDDFLLVTKSSVHFHSKAFSAVVDQLKSEFQNAGLISIIWGSEISIENKEYLKSQVSNFEFVEIDGMQEVWQVLVGVE